MKKCYLLAFTVLLSSSLAGQQQQEILSWASDKKDSCKNASTKVFELDLGLPNTQSLVPRCKERSFKGLTVDSRQLLAFNLINANPYKYDYSIENELVDFFIDEKKGLQEIYEEIKNAQPQTANMEGNGLTDTIREDSSVNEISTIEEGLEQLKLQKAEEVKSLEASKNDYQEMREIIESSSVFAGNQTIQQEQMILDDFESVISSKKKLVNEIKIDINELLEKNKKKSQQVKEAQKKVRENAKKSKEIEQKKNTDKAVFYVLEVKKRLQGLNEAVKLFVVKTSAEDYLDKKNFMKFRDKYYKKYDSLVKGLNSNTAKYELLLSPENIKTYNTHIDKHVKGLSQEITTILSEMHALKLDNYMLPVDFNGENIDVVKITVKRTPRHGNIREPKEYPFKIWVKGGIKIDVSAGVFITNLVDKDYSLIKVSDATDNEPGKSVIYENNQGDFRYGFGSLVHTSFRSARWVRPTLSFGAVFIGDQNPKVQLLTGIGLVLGKKQRIILNYGLAMGSVSKISNGLVADGTTEYEFTSEDNIPQTERFSFGQFFGITYNLSKVRTQKDAND